jgi:hypothetical protein
VSPKSGIAGSNGRLMSSFLSSLQIFFQNGCTSLHSHQQLYTDLIATSPKMYVCKCVYI